MAARIGPVVVGTDFSDSAAIALGEARRLAELLDARLDVVHVVDGNVSAGWGDEGAVVAWLRTAGLEPHELVVRFGNPWVELARYATDVTPTFVVVGSHGRSGYQPLSIGSTASRVTVHARCPVVLVSPRVLEAAEVDMRVAGRDAAPAISRNGPGDMQTDGGKTR